MRSAKTLFCGVVLVLLAVCPPASAEDVYLYAPAYTAVNNIADRPITVDSYGWLHGIDYTGEWLEYSFGLTGFGTYASSILAKGEMGIEFHLRMEITGNDDHSVQVLDFNFTGSGFTG